MKTERNTSKFDVDGIPPLAEAIPLGIQHIIAMIVGNIAPIIILSRVIGLSTEENIILIQCGMISSAIATMIQLYPVKLGVYRSGSRLPVIMGVSFAFLPTLLAIGKSYGVAGIIGAQIIGGISSIFIGISLKRIRIFFPSIVTGTVVLSVGLSLFPVAINYMAGGVGSPTYGSPLNWGIALFVLAVVLYCNQCTEGFTSLAAILIGIIAGYIVSLFFGIVNFDLVRSAAYFTLPRPLFFGVTFEFDAMIAMVIMYLVTSVEAVGVLSATTMGGLNREVSDEELSGGVIGNGIAGIISALLNSFPTATFSQNAGLIVLTKVVSRFVLGVGVALLFVAGLSPKFGALITTIPYAVIGGGTITVFSMISMTGIKLITRNKLTSRDTVIVGLSLALGIGVVQAPQSIAYFSHSFKVVFGGSSVVITTLTALILNAILPKKIIE